MKNELKTDIETIKEYILIVNEKIEYLEKLTNNLDEKIKAIENNKTELEKVNENILKKEDSSIEKSSFILVAGAGLEPTTSWL